LNQRLSCGLLADLSVDTVRRRCEKPGLLPLGAVTFLPRLRADVTELLLAYAGHVVASHCELHEAMAPRAPLPALLLCKSKHCRVVCGRARITAMSSFLAMPARMREACPAHNTAWGVGGCSEERRASGLIAVYAVGDGEFEGFLLEGCCEADAEVWAYLGELECALAAARGK